MSENHRHNIVATAKHCMEVNALILDTETTGLGEDDEIVEVAIVDALGGLEFSALVKPMDSIPEAATNVHGITDEMVAQARRWPEVLPIVREIVGSRPLLAYNSDFDSRMIVQTCQLYEVEESFRWYCLMNDWMQYHGLRRWQRLENVCYEIGVEAGGHRALGDAKAAREVLRWLARQEVDERVASTL